MQLGLGLGFRQGYQSPNQSVRTNPNFRGGKETPFDIAKKAVRAAIDNGSDRNMTAAENALQGLTTTNAISAIRMELTKDDISVPEGVEQLLTARLGELRQEDSFHFGH